MSRRRKVLFLCTGNSARSQMAEALVNHFLGERWQAYSAGTKPAGYVHPLAVQAMAELGVDISGQRSKPVSEFQAGELDLIVTVCDSAAEECPLWLGAGARVHLGFPDPAAATGSPAERLAFFRKVRDDMRGQVIEFLRNWEKAIAADDGEKSDAAAQL